MLIHPTPLDGSALIELQELGDDRGFFARSFCRQDFTDAGLEPTIEQSNVSFNYRRGTLRGFHYQLEPYAEAKTIRCVRGSIYDVIIDMRPDSKTYLRHFSAKLSADNHLAVHVPKNFAHGYLTLDDDTEVMYAVSVAYTPKAERGVRWDDPALCIAWPRAIDVVSAKDSLWPLLTDAPVMER